MADLPVAEGGRPGGGGGLASHGVLLVGIAGVGILAVMLLKGGSSTKSGTTAAGTSINAALGSIQEQELNLMGQVGSGFASTSTQIAGTQAALSQQMTDFNNSQLAAMSGMQQALSDQMNGIDSHLTSIDGSLTQQLSDVNNNVIANGQSVTALGQSLTTYYNNLINAGATNTQALNNTWQAFYQSLMNAVANNGAAASAGANATQKMLSNIGSFLGWEFYQLPNRYSAYIPGSGPGYGNLNVAA